MVGDSCDTIASAKNMSSVALYFGSPVGIINYSLQDHRNLPKLPIYTTDVLRS
jgi:hypothetical protein